MDNPALSALTNAIPAIDQQKAFSDEELAALEARRLAKQAEQELKAGQESKVLKTEYEQALILAEKELDQPLPEREKQWLNKYMRSHKLMAKRITRHLDELKTARQSKANG